MATDVFIFPPRQTPQTQTRKQEKTPRTKTITTQLHTLEDGVNRLFITQARNAGGCEARSLRSSALRLETSTQQLGVSWLGFDGRDGDLLIDEVVFFVSFLLVGFPSS